MLIETILLAWVGELDPPTIKFQVKTQIVSTWNREQWQCANELIHRESRWDPEAKNPTSSAYGLFQQLKLRETTSPARQTRLGIKYIAHRYGSPCKALKHHNRKGWY